MGADAYQCAYSENIGWRMVWQCDVQGFTLERVAWNLSTVHRIVKNFEESGSVSKKKYSVANWHQPQKLSKAVQLDCTFTTTYMVGVLGAEEQFQHKKRCSW